MTITGTIVHEALGYRAECSCGYAGLTWSIPNRPSASKAQAASDIAGHIQREHGFKHLPPIVTNRRGRQHWGFAERDDRPKETP